MQRAPLLFAAEFPLSSHFSNHSWKISKSGS